MRSYQNLNMGKPNKRTEVPTIVVDNLQVALPTLLHDPLVEELEHFDGHLVFHTEGVSNHLCRYSITHVCYDLVACWYA